MIFFYVIKARTVLYSTLSSIPNVVVIWTFRSSMLYSVNIYLILFFIISEQWLPELFFWVPGGVEDLKSRLQPSLFSLGSTLVFSLWLNCSKILTMISKWLVRRTTEAAVPGSNTVHVQHIWSLNAEEFLPLSSLNNSTIEMSTIFTSAEYSSAFMLPQ